MVILLSSCVASSLLYSFLFLFYNITQSFNMRAHCCLEMFSRSTLGRMIWWLGERVMAAPFSCKPRNLVSYQGLCEGKWTRSVGGHASCI